MKRGSPWGSELPATQSQLAGLLLFPKRKNPKKNKNQKMMDGYKA